MAKLGAYYGLCPLIDHRSLLGIFPDEESGVVIVTLGKNIAIKFKVSDQKQLYSWRTKDKFSSPIIFDKQHSQYAAVFNDSFVHLWSGNEEFLDKLKKLKFAHQIHTLFLCNEKSFIVFKSGNVYALAEAVEKRKHLSFDNVISVESEYITEVLHTNFNGLVYVGLVVKSEKNCYLYWTTFNNNNEQSKVHKLSLERKNAELKGYVFHVDRNGVKFLSLWSDGKIYSAELKEDLTDLGELFTVMEAISCKHYVSMTSLDQNYIALYGCNSNEEGALLVVFNVQFKVIQSRQLFKLFSNGAKLWRIEENLFFPVGQNLAVIPFHLDMEQLAALVGSHKVVETNPDPDVSIVHKVQFVNWGNTSESPDENIPELIETKIQELKTQGLNKNMIFDTILVDLLEEKNIETLTAALQYFNDIPEHGLIKIIKLILTLDGEQFTSTDSDCQSCPEKLEPKQRGELLDKVLAKSFNETLLLSHLRSFLSLDEVFLLLKYIYFLLSEDGHALPSCTNVETEGKLIEWSCILLDSNYQRILLTRDEKISEVLQYLKEHISNELNCSEDAKVVASLMREVKRGQSLQKIVHMTNVDYFIEDFPLY